jgi:hypothetical protein
MHPPSKISCLEKNSLGPLKKLDLKNLLLFRMLASTWLLMEEISSVKPKLVQEKQLYLFFLF